eukprot:683264-Amorphochlora_amoeboformis.AAC.1
MVQTGRLGSNVYPFGFDATVSKLIQIFGYQLLLNSFTYLLLNSFISASQVINISGSQVIDISGSQVIGISGSQVIDISDSQAIDISVFGITRKPVRIPSVSWNQQKREQVVQTLVLSNGGPGFGLIEVHLDYEKRNPQAPSSRTHESSGKFWKRDMT